MSILVRSRQAFCGLLAVVSLGVCQSAHAFSLTFQGLVRTVNTGGSITLSSPTGTAIDLVGNLFVADTGNNRIVEVSAQGTASVLSISGLSPALSGPTGIALDGAGDLYIADTGNNRVVKRTAAGAGSVVSTASVTLSAPRGTALDPSGNLYIADTGNNRIVEVTSGGVASALTVTVSSGAATLSAPKGLAVNNSGKLYISDFGNNRIVTVAAGSTTGVVQSIAGGVILSGPSAVQVDGINNVYIADTANNRIAQVDTSGNGTVLLTGSQTLTGPLSLAVDPFGTVYLADTGDNRILNVAPPVDADLTPSSATYSLNKSQVGFGHVQLGTSTATTLTLPFTTGSVGLGAVKVLTAGAQNLDFTNGSSTTCNSTTPANTSCSVQVSFLPTAPGLRYGTVVLYDTSQNPILTLPLYGFSDAPVAALSPNTGAKISTGSLTTSDPFQLAIDGSGNLYVADYTGQNVTKIPAGGGSASLVSLGTPGGTAVQNITGVAVDGAGNLFIADYDHSRILAVTPAGTVSVLSINGLSPALGLPTALAFDPAGNLYIADYSNGRAVEVSTLVVTGSGASGKGTVVNTGSYSFGFDSLTGLCVDPQGNLYLAARTQNSSSIIKVTPSGVASELPIPSNITPAISDPQGVAADGMGNLYIVDTANSRIVRITNANVASVISITGLTSPSTLGSLIFGVTADSSGNLYIPDWTNNRIVYVNVSSAVLSYASTAAGSTSSDSPRTATVTNLGNQALAFSLNPVYPADFTNNSGDTNPCTSSTTLSTGTLCDVSVNFTPQSGGILSATINVTDNNLNVAGSVQPVSVSGTGIVTADATSTTVTATPSTVTVGQEVTITATVADTTAGHTTTVPTGQVTFTDTVGATVISLNTAAPVTLSGGKATLTGVQLSGVGVHTIGAHYAGVASSFLSSSGTATTTLNKASTTITGPATQPVVVGIGQTGSVTVTIVGAATNLAPTGTLAYTILNAAGTNVASGSPALTAGSGSNATAAIAISSTLTSGSYTLNVTYSGDGNYLASSTPLVIHFVVSQATPTISWTPSASSIVYGTTLNGILDATAVYGSIAVPGTFTYTATLSGGSAAAVTSGSILATGSYTLTAVFTPTDSTAYTSATKTISVVVQDFTLSPTGGGSTTPTQTVTPGGTATYALVFGPAGGTTFPNAVTLSVSGLPPGATATLTPQTIAAGSPLTDVKLSIQLAQTTARVFDHHLPSVLWAVLLLPFAGRLRRSAKRLRRGLPVLLLAVAALAAAVGVSGCASQQSGFFGHAQQTYSVVVTATSGSVSHSTTVALIVQ